MSTKQTPGPYKITSAKGPEGYPDGYYVEAPTGLICTFWSKESQETSLANARAVVSGLAALEKLEKIRDILQLCGAGKMNPNIAVVAVGKILTEK